LIRGWKEVSVEGRVVVEVLVLERVVEVEVLRDILVELDIDVLLVEVVTEVLVLCDVEEVEVETDRLVELEVELKLVEVEMEELVLL
jgi:hypothetical protein